MEQALTIITLITTFSVCLFVILFLSTLVYRYAKKDIKFKNARVNLGVVSFDVAVNNEDKKLEELSEKILQIEKRIEQKIENHNLVVVIVVVIISVYLLYYQGKQSESEKA